ncbi:DUF3243 domain-containing protein [Bacillus atrophaeus]|uniref:DUF3243 domain-containing protein n=1 Tax=Bacillus atrophaeus TaxID=1452 RepID=UPI00228122D6|nr:DUF3243 domain-containing protein [Bacillus atrophaeus]MCY8914650.1 DUF3243 domain-containing protein [Bacillus atrophaeus]MCY8973400.1 DUF3243 domain-containing protein [Bacillus atrophaeus]MCY9116308.1 DUF3243 domain-containing protein [Bacillus atrophaeus]MEC0927684.1 DUF3243 domain-containing protein [Bacillus atrophaeus]MEC0934956.1 DUF3243 domain-containing protein [Bacillus atrophaeus]
MNRDKEKIQIENEMHAMHGTDKKDILKDFEEFKAYLKKQVDLGKKFGLDDGKVIKSAAILGDYLAKHEEPQNGEEMLLQELWRVADEDEKQRLAQLLVKLVDTE